MNWKYDKIDEPNLFTVTKQNEQDSDSHSDEEDDDVNEKDKNKNKNKNSNKTKNKNTNTNQNTNEKEKDNKNGIDVNKMEYDSKLLLSHFSSDIDRIANLILESKYESLLIVTGAGMGCDSGLPDYRSQNGFWKDYPPFRKVLTFKDDRSMSRSKSVSKSLSKSPQKINKKKNGNSNNNGNNSNECETKEREKLSLHEMSKSDWFLNDPLFAWGFYSHRTQLYKNAQPHKGFCILKNLTKEYFNNDRYFYVTSNIDDQVYKAGFDELKIWQTHGSLGYIQCVKNCHKSIIEKFNNLIEINPRNFRVKHRKDVCNKTFCQLYFFFVFDYFFFSFFA